SSTGPPALIASLCLLLFLLLDALPVLLDEALLALRRLRRGRLLVARGSGDRPHRRWRRRDRPGPVALVGGDAFGRRRDHERAASGAGVVELCDGPVVVVFDECVVGEEEGVGPAAGDPEQAGGKLAGPGRDQADADAAGEDVRIGRFTAAGFRTGALF